MKFRLSKLITVSLALFSMLFMQLAMASYVCRGTSEIQSHSVGTPDPSMEGMTMAAMSDCEGMDMAQPVLCHTHAQDPLSKQSFDKPQLPDVPAFVGAGILRTVEMIEPVQLNESLLSGLSFHLATAAPPLAILHCCFRI
ncbi:hypothetical protein [Undibacterium griseum]|uniref:Copper resistance protein n=1 Tax=Undibacterium griseum TaxID=2762295 RepID=A0ABR6YMH9_9BURK|nr:hypothetical protein [Undibacterium griseum]MBC3885112.1 hypothetical protein [Undibacterium griseum]